MVTVRGSGGSALKGRAMHNIAANSTDALLGVGVVWCPHALENIKTS